MSEVIRSTLHPLIPSFPPALVPTLLTHFSSSSAYVLYPDVLPLFRELRSLRHSSTNPYPTHHPTPDLKIITGIITNTDTRISLVLSSLGLHTGSPAPDIDLVITSYETGCEKPGKAIWDAAKEEMRRRGWGECRYVHVGDEKVKDAEGARGAGWEGVWLDREGVGVGDDNSIPSLEYLWERIMEAEK